MLSALALPPIVASIFDGAPRHEALSYRCVSPFHSFATPIEVLGGDIAPIWECGVSVTAYQDSVPQGRFRQFSLESPEEVRVIGRPFTAVVADLFATLWEDEVTEAELCDLAAIFEFRDIDHLLAELRVAPREPSYEGH
jgi:hypothetical protein